MTVPTTANTALRLAYDATYEAGLREKGAELDSQDLADCLNKTNDLIQAWQTQGVKLFLLEDLSVTMVAATALYTFGAAGTTVMQKPNRVELAYLQDANLNTIPLSPMSWEEYVRLGTPSSAGQPNQFFVDPQASLLRVKLWPVPNAAAVSTWTLHLVLRKACPILVSLTDDTAFPREWYLALMWGLADEIATGQAQAIMDRCEKRAESYRRALEDWDVENTSVYFCPSYNQYG